ncbi:MAG: hypothetical protein HYY18_17795, partial [Planctomycetes bacterium]|nr:hypothetical protein [Planctomycetota bacterium]
SPAAPPSKGPILKLRPFQIASRYEGREFVWRKSDLEWETDFYNLFFTAPRQTVTDESRAWLAASGLFEHVLDFSSHVDATHVLEGHIVHLYGDARGKGAKAVIEVQFFLVDDRATPSVVAFGKAYAEAVGIKEDSPEELVKGWNEGLGRILGALETDLREAVGR